MKLCCPAGRHQTCSCELRHQHRALAIEEAESPRGLFPCPRCVQNMHAGVLGPWASQTVADMTPGSISTSGSYECSSVHSTQFDRDAASTIVISEPSITQSMASAGSEPPAPDVFSRTMDEVRNIHPLLLIPVFYVSSCSRMYYCRANCFFSKADRPGIQNPVV